MKIRLALGSSRSENDGQEGADAGYKCPTTFDESRESCQGGMMMMPQSLPLKLIAGIMLLVFTVSLLPSTAIGRMSPPQPYDESRGDDVPSIPDQRTGVELEDEGGPVPPNGATGTDLIPCETGSMSVGLSQELNLVAWLTVFVVPH